MRKYIVTVYVKDNRKFGLGEKNLDFLVLGRGNAIEKVTNYLNNTSILFFQIVKVELIEKDVCIENIYEILDYLIVCLYSQREENIKYLDCIKIVNDCISRLKSNSNFDMCIDNMLMGIWEEMNENSYRS